VRAINKNSLEAVGFQVTVAESVDEAFQFARHGHFEVALIDFYMPGGNGDKLISLLRGDPHTMYILPLLFTNAGDEMMAVEAGAVYWMSKDQSNFLAKMALVRDYVQDNRAFQPPQMLPDKFSENRRVLVVDDEEENLKSIHSILTAPQQRELGEMVREIESRAGLVEHKSEAYVAPFELTEVTRFRYGVYWERASRFWSNR
jgi:CheY-like chemotaxis protein